MRAKGNEGNEMATGGQSVQRKSRRNIGLKAFCVIMAVVGVASAIGANRLLPAATEGKQGFSTRVAWYVGHGQLKADMRTFGAAAAYFVRRESPPLAHALSTNPPVARALAVSQNKS